MKKEILLAVIIGLVFGLIITYGIYRATISLSQPTRPSNANASPSPSASAATNSSLAIISPEDESVQSSREVTITGKTLANAYVVIFVNNNESITTADADGNFSLNTTLELGSNIITIHAIDEDGSVTKQEVTVVVNPPAQPTATGSAQTTTQ